MRVSVPEIALDKWPELVLNQEEAEGQSQDVRNSFPDFLLSLCLVLSYSANSCLQFEINLLRNLIGKRFHSELVAVVWLTSEIISSYLFEEFFGQILDLLLVLNTLV